MEMVKRTIMCGECGDATSPALDYYIEAEEDTLILPLGWVAATVTRTALNADWEEPQTVESLLSEMTADIPGAPAEKAAMMAMFRPIAEGQLRQEDALPRYMQEVADMHLCPKCSHLLLKLDTHAFDAAGWDGGE